MTYVMSERMYKEYRTGKGALSHANLIAYLNDSLNFRGTITKISVK